MRVLLLSACLVALTIAGCASPTPGEEPCDRISGAVPGETPYVDPETLGADVDNPYFPLPPGKVWTYEGEEDGEPRRVVTEVLRETRTVLGVETRVVWDRVWTDDRIFEETWDWYAQSPDGTVWYMGEDTQEYDDEGNVETTEGSWEAGVDGARPGIIMQADPRPSEDAYREEEWVEEAEDVARVIARGVEKAVPYGSFDDVLVTEDCNPLEPEIVENKFYAPGVGLLMEHIVVGGEEKVELVDVAMNESVPER